MFSFSRPYKKKTVPDFISMQQDAQTSSEEEQNSLKEALELLKKHVEDGLIITNIWDGGTSGWKDRFDLNLSLLQADAEHVAGSQIMFGKSFNFTLMVKLKTPYNSLENKRILYLKECEYKSLLQKINRPKKEKEEPAQQKRINRYYKDAKRKIEDYAGENFDVLKVSRDGEEYRAGYPVIVQIHALDTPQSKEFRWHLRIKLDDQELDEGVQIAQQELQTLVIDKSKKAE